MEVHDLELDNDKEVAKKIMDQGKSISELKMMLDKLMHQQDQMLKMLDSEESVKTPMSNLKVSSHVLHNKFNIAVDDVERNCGLQCSSKSKVIESAFNVFDEMPQSIKSKISFIVDGDEEDAVKSTEDEVMLHKPDDNDDSKLNEVDNGEVRFPDGDVEVLKVHNESVTDVTVPFGGILLMNERFDWKPGIVVCAKDRGEAFDLQGQIKKVILEHLMCLIGIKLAYEDVKLGSSRIDSIMGKIACLSEVASIKVTEMVYRWQRRNIKLLSVIMTIKSYCYGDALDYLLLIFNSMKVQRNWMLSVTLIDVEMFEWKTMRSVTDDISANHALTDSAYNQIFKDLVTLLTAANVRVGNISLGVYASASGCEKDSIDKLDLGSGSVHVGPAKGSLMLITRSVKQTCKTLVAELELISDKFVKGGWHMSSKEWSLHGRSVHLNERDTGNLHLDQRLKRQRPNLAFTSKSTTEVLPAEATT